jgi:hypothetical protein
LLETHNCVLLTLGADELQRKLLLPTWMSFDASSGDAKREGESSEERLRETRSREG